MKRVLIVLTIVALLMFVWAFAKTAYASSSSNTVTLSFTVIGSIALNIDESVVLANCGGHESEAFSELKDRYVLVDKLTRNNKNLWLFTKTE
jgi:hypothetical protein